MDRFFSRRQSERSAGRVHHRVAFAARGTATARAGRVPDEYPVWGAGGPSRPRQGAYARKMEPEETPDFSAFGKMRRIPLDPESVIGRELHDRFAEFDESFTGHSRIWSVVVKLIGLTAMCSKAVIDLEKQVIELRRELRSRDKA